MGWICSESEGGKIIVEEMGFMPEDFPDESELKSMTAQQKADIEQQFVESLDCGCKITK